MIGINLLDMIAAEEIEESITPVDPKNIPGGPIRGLEAPVAPDAPKAGESPPPGPPERRD